MVIWSSYSVHVHVHYFSHIIAVLHRDVHVGAHGCMVIVQTILVCVVCSQRLLSYRDIHATTDWCGNDQSPVGNSSKVSKSMV